MGRKNDLNMNRILIRKFQISHNIHNLNYLFFFKTILENKAPCPIIENNIKKYEKKIIKNLIFIFGIQNKHL